MLELMANVYAFFTEAFSYQFMRQALIAIVLTSLSCASLGVYVVLRRMAFIGDALAHTMLPGIVIAYLNQWQLSLGAMVSGVVTALGIGWLSRRAQLREDTAIGVIFTAMFALGILLMSRARALKDLSHILFGNILGVSREDIYLMAGVTLLVLLVLALLHKELELSSYDRYQAQTSGISADGLRYILLILLALTVVSTIQVVGVILTSALLITPAAAASLLSHHLPRMMLLASGIALFSGVAGLCISYVSSYAAGPAIVLVCSGIFVLVWLGQSLR